MFIYALINVSLLSNSLVLCHIPWIMLYSIILRNQIFTSLLDFMGNSKDSDTFAGLPLAIYTVSAHGKKAATYLFVAGTLPLVLHSHEFITNFLKISLFYFINCNNFFLFGLSENKLKMRLCSSCVVKSLYSPALYRSSMSAIENLSISISFLNLVQ